jgi:hypothetical protein
LSEFTSGTITAVHQYILSYIDWEGILENRRREIFVWTKEKLNQIVLLRAISYLCFKCKGKYKFPTSNIHYLYAMTIKETSAGKRETKLSI